MKIKTVHLIPVMAAVVVVGTVAGYLGSKVDPPSPYLRPEGGAVFSISGDLIWGELGSCKVKILGQEFSVAESVCAQQQHDVEHPRPKIDVGYSSIIRYAPITFSPTCGTSEAATSTLTPTVVDSGGTVR